jgi:hypothetical protein
VRRHVYEFGDAPWPEGTGVLQVYALIDLDANPQLARLVERVRAAMVGAPVWEVPDCGLHATLDLVAGRTSDHVPLHDRDALVEALGERLAGVSVYLGHAGSALAYGNGVMLDVSPAAPLAGVQQLVRDVIREVCGDDACTWRQSKPHVSTHYCHTPTESDPWQRALRRIDPNNAPLVISEVALVDVRPDLHTNQLHWQPVAAPIPFGVPLAPHIRAQVAKDTSAAPT